MSRKYLYYSLIIVLILVIVLGALFIKSNSKTDAIKFKEEYEQYNDSLTKLNIDSTNPFVYRDDAKIKKIIKNNTGMIFIGNAKSEDARTALKIILPLAKTNEVKKIFYLDSNDIKSSSIKKYKDDNICVIFVIAGEVVATYTYDDFNDEKIKKDINYYMQLTFNDYCDDTCND